MRFFFSLVVPGALLFTREMNCAISKDMRSNKSVCLYKALQEEITHWLFLENWDDPLPWRDERHLRISLATDASGSGWGVESCYHHAQQVSQITGRRRDKVMISTQEKQSL